MQGRWLCTVPRVPGNKYAPPTPHTHTHTTIPLQADGYDCALPTTSVCMTGKLALPSCDYITPTATMTATETCNCQNGACVDCCPWRCLCHSSLAQGYWSGELCDECAPGWWGTSCTKQCPNGPCNPCGGHGTCSDGVSGTGKCTCALTLADGYWQGDSCTECAAGWTGNLCQTVCPSCNGHGVCTNSGGCECSLGFDPSTECSTCLPERELQQGSCKSLCIGETSDSKECSAHGVCTQGKCACSAGFWGAGCEETCLCLRGTCDPVGGICTCESGFALPHCTTCTKGLWGDNCDKQCACSDHGGCDRGGTCQCDEFWTGSSCHLRCEGSHAPCSGHGKCSESGGSPICTCDVSVITGHWEGSDCSRCAPDWWGSSCTLTCNEGKGCNGGTCYKNGRCGCILGGAMDLCGSGCDKTDCDYCPGYATWGFGCMETCPGGAVPCSGHGHCDASQSGTGACWCDEGFVGDACENECPSSFSQTCGGPTRGMCLPTGKCQCLNGWGGNNCDTTCPTYNSEVCGGRGSCSGDPPVCACNEGYGGPSCGYTCSCGHHSTCDDFSRACQCLGNFRIYNGLCIVCAKGFSGSDCNGACVNGEPSETTTDCICEAGYSGPSCESECPYADNKICGGNGACISGTGLPESTCNCNPGWYGAACTVTCEVADCNSAGMQNAQCDTSGTCACMDNLGGHWAGDQCDTCKDQWYVLTSARSTTSLFYSPSTQVGPRLHDGM